MQQNFCMFQPQASIGIPDTSQIYQLQITGMEMVEKGLQISTLLDSS